MSGSSSRVQRCREAFLAGRLRTAAQRRSVLQRIIDMIVDNTAALVTAAAADLRKPAFEFLVAEVEVVRQDASAALAALDRWMAPTRAERPAAYKLDRASIVPEPFGTVLIIGAWNYPLQLLLLPLVGAIAAGNTAVLKPSEIAPEMAMLLSTLVHRYLPGDVAVVVTGGVPETTALLAERFDHITYTGCARVGRIVMAAAAKNLTPVLLELGGKSPVVVDVDCDIDTVARRIMWGKVFNCGQTCVAPDYVLVDRRVRRQLIDGLRAARTEFLSATPQHSKDYGRIVNDAHFRRLAALMSGGKIVFGGETDAGTRYIAPTVLDDCDLSAPLMTDEIFGPLLPIVPYDTMDEAIRFVNGRDKPLALYVFSRDARFVDEVCARTSSGAVAANDVLVHTLLPALPFGGVGQSGMGAYHGKHSFDAYSHRKSVLRRSQAMERVNALRYPPTSDAKLRVLQYLSRSHL
jgi:acyl-CoA reductase-like NAD-dependent aldehyde dehydrogenase